MEWIKSRIAAVRDWRKGWRTVIVGALVASAGTLLEILQAFEVVDITPLLGSRGPLIIAILGVVKVALRLVTTGPVGAK